MMFNVSMCGTQSFSHGAQQFVFVSIANSW